MINRRLPAWQKVVALAPLLLLLVSLPGQVLLRCRMDGLVRSACCCPQRNEPPSPIPAAKAQDCCDREVTINERVPADANRNPVLDLAALTLTLIADAVPLPPFAEDRQPANLRSHGPPKNGPSVVLLKHAFLI